MDEVEIQVVQLKVLECELEGWQHILFIVFSTPADNVGYTYNTGKYLDKWING